MNVCFCPLKCIGEYPLVGGPSHLFNSGGGYRITKLNRSTYILVLVSITMGQHIFWHGLFGFGLIACFERIDASVGFLQ